MPRWRPPEDFAFESSIWNTSRANPDPEHRAGRAEVESFPTRAGAQDARAQPGTLTGGRRITSHTPSATSAMPATFSPPSGSSNSSQAMTAVTGGTR